MQATTMCVPTIATEAPAAAAPAAAAPVRLTVSKQTALRHLKARMQSGVAIRRRSVRYMEDLEEARSAKAEWVGLVGEMLRQMFHGDAGGGAAERFNDWVGRVYPDYAEMELFVGQFYEEMDHRLARLRDVVRQVMEMTDLVPITRAPAPAHSADNAGSTKVEIMPATSPAQPYVTAPPSNAPVAKAPSRKPAAATAAAPAAHTVILDDIPEPETPDVKPAPGGLLLVHDGAASHSAEVRTFLQTLGIDVRVIQANSQDAKAATAALEQHRDAASYAAVMLGADEAGQLRAPAGPCSVTFQLGYLAGRLGASRICILSPGANADGAPDAFGIRTLALDQAHGWHLQLARHLKKGGIEVDLNKLC
jgi:hypothetical protein